MRQFILSLPLILSSTLAIAWSPLQDPADAALTIDAEEPVVIDIRSTAAYAKGHVEGAVNVPYHAWRGPETNPGAMITPEKLSLLLSEAGVEPDLPVLVVHEGEGTLDFASAARVYWTLKSAGVGRIAILNGGVRAWTAAGLELSTEEGANFPSDLTFDFEGAPATYLPDVAAALDGDRETILVDARPTEFHDGRERHPMATAAGALPGSANLVHEDWFDGARMVVTPEEARLRLAALGIDGSVPVVNYCNTGHWGATNWFVMSEIAGVPNVTLYPESWVGWTRALVQLAAR